MTAWNLPNYKVVDATGNVVEATVTDKGVRFGYDLPEIKEALKKAFYKK